jgi:predicted RNase H-like nuclease (RuvC/YqgF family)
LPDCPKCGNKEVSPYKSFSIIVEPSKGEHGMVERKVGMYNCSKCGTKFPTVMSRQRYLIVAAEQLRSLQDELGNVKRDNQELEVKVQGMAREHRELQARLERLAKDSEIDRMETKLAELEAYVEHLRKEKGELEQRVSKLR